MLNGEILAQVIFTAPGFAIGGLLNSDAPGT
jgi:hypothetical protein